MVAIVNNTIKNISSASLNNESIDGSSVAVGTDLIIGNSDFDV